VFAIGAPKAGVIEIGWEEFLAEFGRANLAFVYRDAAPDGDLDDFHQFVIRSAVPELTLSNRTTIVERVV
jgi:hypothetical protein